MVQRFPIIIEMLGPSGSGKSTLLKAAQPQLETSGWCTPLNFDDRAAITPGFLYRKQPLDHLAQRELVRLSMKIAAKADWAPSQAQAAIQMLSESCRRDHVHRNRADGRPLLHDELILHRAFSLLPRSTDWAADAEEFFGLVALPSAAIVVQADTEVNLERLAHRGLTNVTRGLDSADLREVVERSHRISDIATQVLIQRGVPVLCLDSREEAAVNVQRLVAFVTSVRADLEAEDPQAFLRQQIIEVSGSFHTRGRRHLMRTQGVAYGSISVPGFSIAPADAQRDTAKRLEQFGVTRSDIQGRSVIDIGCNTGAVLFELSKLGPRQGLGIEIDADKVAVAAQIRNHLELPFLAFEVCNIERLLDNALPAFDVTFALAVESHVRDKERFYRFLSQVTRERLYFEANAGADLDEVKDMLTSHGFGDLETKGQSTDDRDPRNHRRQLLVARRIE